MVHTRCLGGELHNLLGAAKAVDPHRVFEDECMASNRFSEALNIFPNITLQVLDLN